VTSHCTTDNKTVVHSSAGLESVSMSQEHTKES